MNFKVKDLMAFFETYAPSETSYDWDNIGLLIGNKEKIVNKVLITLDVIPQVVAEAIEKNVDIIISHHPVIFSGVKSLAKEDWHTKMLVDLVKSDIAVYSAHTNLDIASGGVNDILAEKLKLSDVKILDVLNYEKFYKIAVFVPKNYELQVTEAMCQNGAGFIGRYSDCAFSSQGTGRFRALEGTEPFVGRVGEIAEVEEVKIETIVTGKVKAKVIDAILKSHPYEEVAYDVYLLENEKKLSGIGRIGILYKEMDIKEFSLYVKKSLKLDHVLYADGSRKIKKVALCGGAGSDLISLAQEKGADVLLSSDFKYHEMQNAALSGLNIVDAGHQGTEMPVLEILFQKISELNKKIKVFIAKEEIIRKCL